MLSREQMIEAHERIKMHIHKTPLVQSQTLSAMVGCSELVLKCENQQKVGAFKARGAFNKLVQLVGKVKAVCTHSSGNHGQAVAFAARKLGLISYIVMPTNSSQVKIDAVRGYGGNVVLCGVTLQDRSEAVERVRAEKGAEYVSPYDDWDIIAGQGTCVKEVFDDRKDFDYVVFPIGGGGLSSGSVLATKYFGGSCQAIGVEPWLARDAKLSLQNNKIHPQLPPTTIADGLRTSLGERNFSVLSALLPPQNVILVLEQEIISAMRLVMERTKLVVEPSAAATVAAVIRDSRFRDKKVCCIMSGGNVDMAMYFDGLYSKL